MTTSPRYRVLLPERELERSRQVDPTLVPWARRAALEALRNPANAGKETDFWYFIGEDGDVQAYAPGAVMLNWIGLVGSTLYENCSVKRAINAVWHDLDIPHALVPSIRITYGQSFKSTAERLEALFAELDQRLIDERNQR